MSTTSLLSSVLGASNSSTAVDISSILEAATGASSTGIDVTSAVNSAVTAAEGPENIWNAQITLLASETTALTKINTDTTTLDNDMQSLNSLSGPLSQSTVASSNSSVVTATAASGTAAGNISVVVTNLASTASYSSTTVASATTALPAESFTLTNSSGAGVTLTTSGTDTLTDLENSINSAGIGVTASIATDTSGARLVLTSDTSGSAGSFTASSTGTTFAFATAGKALNASLMVNGVSISSSTNTVTGAVPGLTLNLLSASPGTTANLTVAPNTTAVSTAINKFVTDYNAAVADLNTQFTYTSGSGEGPLAQDSAVQNLQNTLEQAVGYTATPASGNTTTTVPNLTSLGIAVGSDGTLSVDSTTLSNVLQNNFGDVQNFFQGASLNGFASVLDKQLTSFTSTADGAFTVDLQSIATQSAGLSTDITNFQTNVLVPLQTKMQSDFSQAEILLQQLPNEIKQIDTELGENSSSSS